MKHISVVVSAYNEESTIGRCLSSVAWADERILVDNSSSDQTVNVAKRFNVRVITRKNDPMLNVNKNAGFDAASGEWILNLDADEEIPVELQKEIEDLKAQKEVDGYWISRKNIIFGKWIRHGLWWPDRQLRLFRRGSGKFPCKHVHEKIEVAGKTDELQSPFIHYNYNTISQFIGKMDSIYTANQMENLRLSGYRFNWADAIRFPVSDFNKIFFAQKGYRDGLHGLVLGILQAFVSFVVFAKYWEQQGFRDISLDQNHINQELDRSGKEIQYWRLTGQIESSRTLLSRIMLTLQRKLLNAS